MKRWAATVLVILVVTPVAASRGAGADRDTLALTAPPLHEPALGLLRTDRLQHASFSFTCALGFSVATGKPALGGASALALGVAKELWDRDRTGFDWHDLAADALGTALAVTLGAALTR